jgi:hypothetical protein
MDTTRWERRLLGASLPAALWVTALELGALARAPGLPSSALVPLGAATLGLAVLWLAPFGLVALALCQLPPGRRLLAALEAHPRLCAAFGVVALLLSLALHWANARLYVRLYAGIRARSPLAGSISQNESSSVFG